MATTLDKVLYGMFLLILVYLFATNWAAFNAYISSMSQFTQIETQLLQGRPTVSMG